MNPKVLDGQSYVRGKCQFWRERMHEEDRWDLDVKRDKKRVRCTCFVEGTLWDTDVATLPDDCPSRWSCRYHIQAW